MFIISPTGQGSPKYSKVAVPRKYVAQSGCVYDYTLKKVRLVISFTLKAAAKYLPMNRKSGLIIKCKELNTT